ncbi:tetratricopeptide repeat protein [Streptomyces sp. NPDC003247]|uniref:tetratricopeptide repeat protein n=1 Tax=Streptomyces sp. NPDC003247 TaxID=3364677 RepID=UPI0036C3CC04
MHERTFAETPDPEPELTAAETGLPGAARTYADLLTRRGQVDQALPWWEKAVAEGDAQAARTLAIVHRDRWDFAGAERWYRSAAGRDGGCAFGLATLLEEAGDHTGAREWYARGAELGSVECLTNGAVRLARRGEWDEALERLEEAEERGDRVAAHARAALTRLLDDLERRETDLAEAERNGDSEAAYEALRELTDGGYDDAFDAYPAAAAAAEALFARAAAAGSAEALVDQAVLAARDDSRWAEVRALAERGHARGYPGAAYVLGVWWEQRGELRKAEEWYRTAAGSDGGHLVARVNLGLLCERQLRFDEAEEWLRGTGVDEENQDPWDTTHDLIVRTLADIEEARARPGRPSDGELRERLPGLTAAAEADGAGPEEMTACADALDRLQRLPEAAEWYRRAGTPRALLALGRMLYERGGAGSRHVIPFLEPAADAGDAGAAYDIAVLHDRAKDERSAGLWHLRAARLGHGRAAWYLGRLSQQRGGDPQFAERWYARAAETGLSRPAYLAGRSMVRYGRHAEAERWLRLAFDDGIVQASYHLGRALRAQGRQAEAEEWLRRAVERRDEFELEQDGLGRARADARPELAGLLVDAERDEEAAGLVGELLEQYPRHVEANRLAGILARRRGDLPAAEKHFEVVADWNADAGTKQTLREIRALLHQVGHQH